MLLGSILFVQYCCKMCVSRALTDAERKYSAIEKEMLGVKYSCRKFRVYILGRKTDVHTDHRPYFIGIFLKLELDNKRLQSMKNDVCEFDWICVGYQACTISQTSRRGWELCGLQWSAGKDGAQ